LEVVVSVSPRQPDINTDPKHLNTPAPSSVPPHLITDYKPQPPGRALKEAQAIAKGTSFVSRLLKVIIAGDKHFETITGLDGFTFGIKDWVASGVASFAKDLKSKHPKEFHDAFGGHEDEITSEKWCAENNTIGDHHAGKTLDDKGLIKFQWLRVGFDKILSNKALHDFQLDHFLAGTIKKSLAIHKQRDFKLEFTLAMIAGAANSAGEGKVQEWLGKGTEEECAKHLVRVYASLAPKSHDPAYDEKMIEIGFGETEGELSSISKGKLGHKAERIFLTFQNFPWSEQKAFTELGKFGS
jgi:hypothetical protein